jgi:hypothetical protein
MWNKEMRHLPLGKIPHSDLQAASDKQKIGVDGEVPTQEKVATPAGETTINIHQSMFLTGEGKSRN